MTDRILNDRGAVCDRRFMRVHAKFNVRGGIRTSVVAEHRRPAWKAPEIVTLP